MGTTVWPMNTAAEEHVSTTQIMLLTYIPDPRLHRLTMGGAEPAFHTMAGTAQAVNPEVVVFTPYSAVGAGGGINNRRCSTRNSAPTCKMAQ